MKQTEMTQDDLDGLKDLIGELLEERSGADPREILQAALDMSADCIDGAALWIDAGGSDLYVSSNAEGELLEALEAADLRRLSSESEILAGLHQGMHAAAAPFGAEGSGWRIGAVSGRPISGVEKVLNLLNQQLDGFAMFEEKDSLTEAVIEEPAASDDLTAERQAVRSKVKTILESDGLDGFGDALANLQSFLEADRIVALYLSDHDAYDHEPRDRRVETAHAADGKTVPPPARDYALNEGLGGNLIAYDGEPLDSEIGMQALGIIRSVGDEAPPCQTIVLEDRTRTPNRVIGKMFIVGCPPLQPADADLVDAVAMQIETRIAHFHAVKGGLTQSIRADQANYLIRRSYASSWAFDQPRQTEAAVAQCGVKNFAEIAVSGNAAAVQGARQWIDMERALAVQRGGYFEVEAGDCVETMFGPPLYEISMDALRGVSSAGDLDALMKELPPNSERYAYMAAQFALASAAAAEELNLGGVSLELSIGVEVGEMTIGNFTGSEGSLSAVGDAASRAARLQELAKHGEIAIGPVCQERLEGYRRSTLDDSLPFEIREAGNAQLKGYDEPVTYYTIHPLE
ncbi:MAG: hypothetical protein OXT69_09540 [Candidatus Poribacteria bacterium]|nr:hypothetical protein [Candidatus Poribacteria bacterium]